MKQIISILLIVLSIEVSAQTIGIFQDPDYYELNNVTEPCLDEVFNITTILNSYGYNNTVPINDINDIPTQLSGLDILIFPDMELGFFANDLTSNIIQAIQSFVQNGGRVIAMGDTQSASNGTGSILNPLFGYGIATIDFGPGTNTIESSTADFACFNTLPNQFMDTSPEGNWVILGPLPSNATVLFSGPFPDTHSVVYFTEGTGSVIYLAWDFRQSIGNCRDVNPDWNEVLNCSIAQFPITPVPTLSQWGIIFLFILMMILFQVITRQEIIQLCIRN